MPDFSRGLKCNYINKWQSIDIFGFTTILIYLVGRVMLRKCTVLITNATRQTETNGTGGTGNRKPRVSGFPLLLPGTQPIEKGNRKLKRMCFGFRVSDLLATNARQNPKPKTLNKNIFELFLKIILHSRILARIPNS